MRLRRLTAFLLISLSFGIIGCRATAEKAPQTIEEPEQQAQPTEKLHVGGYVYVTIPIDWTGENIENEDAGIAEVKLYSPDKTQTISIAPFSTSEDVDLQKRIENMKEKASRTSERTVSTISEITISSVPFYYFMYKDNDSSVVTTKFSGSINNISYDIEVQGDSIEKEPLNAIIASILF
jgi:hypothetical protein